MKKSQNYELIQSLLKERILFLDGAMGTMIQRHGLEEEDYRGERFADWESPLKGMNDLLVLTQPQIIKGIHEAYLEAGADIIETNNFNATASDLMRYNLQDYAYELNKVAAEVAKESAEKFNTEDKPRFVAGVLGPNQKTAYSLAVKGLIDGGVDIILIETIFDTLNAKAAAFAVLGYFEEIGVEYPIMLSGTITDNSGRTLTGQVTEAFYNSLAHTQPLSIGLNCALGPDDLRAYVQELSRVSEFEVSAHPNAGLPNELGEYDMTPEEMAGHIAEWADSGFVNIVGGCCGSSPDHIAAIYQAVKDKTPRQLA